jgi:Uncharacterised protein family UPF0547
MPEQSIVRIYKGNQERATAAFQSDAAALSSQGYVPSSQVWVPGTYGCGSFVLAALLCIILIGFIVFIYMLLVKPPGTLTVAYEHRISSTAEAQGTKDCPKCAETIKAAAVVCRHCGHEFTAAEQGVFADARDQQQEQQRSAAAKQRAEDARRGAMRGYIWIAFFIIVAVLCIWGAINKP